MDPGIGAKEVRPEAVVQVGAVAKEGRFKEEEVVAASGYVFPA